MKLYLLRHADALPGFDDGARPLSEKGREQSRRLGHFLREAQIAFDVVYSSPLVRARQTAELVLQAAGQVKPEVLQIVDALLNETSAQQFEGWLRCLPVADHVLLVGHNPSLSHHVRALLGLEDPGSLDLPKGALVCLRTDDGRAGALKFYLTPKLLR